MKKRTKTWVIVTFLILSLVGSLIPGRPIAASPVTGASIDAEVQEALTSDQDLDVIFFYRDPTPTEAATETLSKLTDPMKKDEMLHRWIGTLKENSFVAQKTAKEKLADYQEQGLVKHFESAYIVNALHVIGKAEAIQALAQDPMVKTVKLNEKHHLIEPLQETETEAEVDDKNVSWNVKMINAPSVWSDFKITGEGTTVGIIDSGVEFDHPALKDRWRGYDEATGEIVEPEKNWFEAIPAYFIEQSPIPVDSTLSHGTHVAGIIMGAEESGKNQIGVAPDTKYIAARAFDATGNTDDFVLIRAGEWMLAPGGDPDARPDVVNCSWSDGYIESTWYHEVIDKWRAAGIVPVFAAGNARATGGVGPYTIESPANYQGSFAVGAVAEDYSLGGFSKKGPSIFDQDKEVKEIKPEVTAPGVAIRSSIYGKGYGLKSGTSMAAPHVAGTIALMRQANPGLSVAEIEAILEETARPTTDNQYPESPNMSFGYGVIDSYAAVGRAMQKSTQQITGRVTQRGDDTEQPNLSVNIPEGTYIHQDIHVSISATDNIGIDEITFEYQSAGTTEWKKLSLERLSGKFKDIRYQGVIDAEEVLTGTMNFRWKAVDFNGNITEGSATREISPAIKVSDSYTNDFETEVNGWLLTGDFKRAKLSTWSMPDQVGAHSGENVLGGNPIDPWNLTKNTISTATLPPLDLTEDVDQPGIGYYFRYFPNRDFTMKAEVSSDMGDSWITAREYNASAQTWIYDQIDLSDYKGQKHVLVRFVMSVKEDLERGFLLDDVSLIANQKDKPSAPDQLTVKQVARGPQLTWQSTSETTKEYKLYRGTDEADVAEYQTFPAVVNNSLARREFIDTEAEDGIRYFYKISALDYFGNESDPSQAVSITNYPVEPIYYNDFEDNDGGLTTYAINGEVTDWEWGNSSHVLYNPTKLWATNLEKGVTGGTEYALETPDMEIPADGAVLKFKSYTDIYYDPDPTQFSGNNNVEVSSDQGKTWKELIGPDVIMEWNSQNEWLQLEASLDEYAGKTIRLRFHNLNNHHANSNPSYPEYGWFIDDLEVAANLTTVENINVSALSPNLSDLQASDIDTEAGQELMAEGQVQQSLPAGEIPLQGAKIMILDNGINHLSDEDGSYTLAVPDETKTYQVMASKYGYHSKTLSVAVTKGEPTELNFLLEKKQNGQIKGVVKDEAGQPVPGAFVRVVEDSRVPIAETDDTGAFVIPAVLEGEYTLRVVASQYAVKETQVTVKPGQDSQVEVVLKAEDTIGEWIKYDNGKKTDTIAYNEAGTGFAVRFRSLGTGRLTKGSFFFVDDWPEMYGQEIKVGVLQKDPDTGVVAPVGTMEPVFIERGKFNEIDFTKLGVELEPGEEFYLATEQMYSGGNNPALGIDSVSPFGENSFVWNGSLMLLSEYPNSETQGSLMIRALVEYSHKVTQPPVFTDLPEESFYVEPEQTVKGTTVENGLVHLNQNGAVVKEIEVTEHAFNSEVTLVDGVNTVSATLTSEAGVKSVASSEHRMILDREKPELSIDEPPADAVIDGSEVKVSGTVKDEYLDKVLINGIEAILTDNGYEGTIPLTNGANEIVVDAFDKAGNRTRLTRQVKSRSTLEIKNVKPDQDVTVKAGETVLIQADTEAGALGSYTVSLPQTLQSTYQGTLKEVTPGHYEALWEAPADLAAENLLVRVSFRKNGASAGALAQGRVTVIKDDVITPIEDLEIRRIDGSNRFATAAKLSQLTFADAPVAVLTNSESMSDALSASPLATVLGGPVLLTKADSIPTATLHEIERLGARKVVVIGGEMAISSKALAALPKTLKVERIAGTDRYDTSRLVANRVLELSGSNSIFFVGPDKYSDALAAGAYVAEADVSGVTPIVMTKPGRVVNFRGVERAFLIGGSLAIPENLEKEIHDMGYATERITGSDRHQTAVNLARRFMENPSGVLVTNGLTLIDGLAAGNFCVKHHYAMISGAKDQLPKASAEYLKTLRPRTVYLAGGKLALSDAVVEAIKSLIE